MSHLNGNGDKVCQKQHWKMQLDTAELQDEMHEQSQHSADTCVQTKTRDMPVIMLQQGFACAATYMRPVSYAW